MAARKTQLDAALTRPGAAAKKSKASVSRDAVGSSDLTQNDITILAETFRLLGDPSRLKIMLRCLEGSSSVGEIAECLDLSQSLVSHHLRLLRGARLVKGERQAKQIFYTVADKHVSRVLLDMVSHIAEDHGEE